MHTYELVIVGAGVGRTVRGWRAALREAALDAARTNQGIEVWQLRPHHRRHLRKVTVFPDGSRARTTPLHRRPTLA